MFRPRSSQILVYVVKVSDKPRRSLINIDQRTPGSTGGLPK